MTPPAKLAAVTACAMFGHERSGSHTDSVPGAAYGPYQLGTAQLGPSRSDCAECIMRNDQNTHRVRQRFLPSP